jgi:hypothetical protein
MISQPSIAHPSPPAADLLPACLPACRLAHVYDEDALMTGAFKGVGPMPADRIALLRAAAIREVEEQAQSIRHKLALLVNCSKAQ